MAQWTQVIGAVLILTAYTLAQLHQLEQHTYTYLLLNLVGSFILAVLAAMGRQWGFLLLEGVWALVSLGGLIARIRGRYLREMR